MLIAWLVGLLTMLPLPEPMQVVMAPPSPLELPSQVAGQVGDPINPTVWWIGGGVLAVAAIAVLFVLAMRRYQAVAEDDVAEMHEGILSIDLLKAQLAELLHRRRHAAGAAAPYVPLVGDDPGIHVRRTYQQLLQWAVDGGHARSPGMTPEHYCQVLAVAYPSLGGDFAVITSAYSQARYSFVSVTAGDADRAAAAWQQIRASAAAAPNAK
jgi:hypothetical protein